MRRRRQQQQQQQQQQLGPLTSPEAKKQRNTNKHPILPFLR